MTSQSPTGSICFCLTADELEVALLIVVGLDVHCELLQKCIQSFILASDTSLSSKVLFTVSEAQIWAYVL